MRPLFWFAGALNNRRAECAATTSSMAKRTDTSLVPLTGRPHLSEGGRKGDAGRRQLAVQQTAIHQGWYQEFAAIQKLRDRLMGNLVYEHILISSDGSELAQAGVQHGLNLAKLHGSKVTAVTVTEPLGGQFAFASDLWSPSQDEIAAYDKAQAAVAERILARIRQSAEAAGVPIDTVHVAWRLPASALVEAAEQRGCSLMVMASHGHTGVSQVMLGSQTARAVATSKVPVLVVR